MKKKFIKIPLFFKISMVVFVVMAVELLVFSNSTSKKVTDGMSLSSKNHSIALTKSVMEKLENNQTCEKELYSLVDNKILSIGFMLNNVPFNSINSNMLMTLSKDTSMSEINVVDSNFKILYSNMSDNVGYIYPSDHKIRNLAADNKNYLLEEARVSTVDNKSYKYGTVKLKNNAYVQIGLSVDNIKKLLNKFTMQKSLESLKENKSVLYAAMVEPNGNISAHSEKDLNSKKFNMPSLLLKSQKDKPVVIDSYVGKYKQHVKHISVPYIKNGAFLGSIIIGISNEDTLSLLKNINDSNFTVMIIGLLLSIVVLWITLVIILRPLKKLNKATSEIAEGNFDVKINIKSRDEIGVLGNNFKCMVELLNEKMTTLRDNVKKSSLELLRLSSSQSDSASTNFASFEEILSASQKVTESTTIASESAQKLSDKAMETTEIMASIEEEIKTVLSSTESTEIHAKQGSEDVKDMVNKIIDINTSMSLTKEKMDSLIKASSEIEKITYYIDDIANQTNLLALNAQIESARAGDAGRGFAVVANEIGKLANESLTYSKNINNLVKTTQKQIEDMLKLITNSSVKTEEGNKVAIVMKNTYDKILNSFSVSDDNLRSSSEKMFTVVEAVKEFNNAVENITQANEEIAASMEEISSSINEQTNSMEKLMEEADLLNNTADLLEKSIDDIIK
ncbi:Methyl-accepting chemotaxis protein [Hathewaya proteolytica DSM 3090]|uniref:Methyl-accepting chemotaxis protein n=1 Tax=Hathewaya proteolytica DSM 3090 TaxID=1121331 RepID=A0A1M6MTE0_9CLOT|nr:HAMP domain-containing methyl-accepting chemotaxis protein [Hathewaya proteolytica]SHJ86649.1 Methyl-accepting chemotaxis protein [Hathewaya proteolytica DSM 3090]